MFANILLDYKETLSTMIATIGGYKKGYDVGNIDFGCLTPNELMKDLNDVVPTEFFIDTKKDVFKDNFKITFSNRFFRTVN